MKRQGQTNYTDEFKQEAVRLVVSSGRKVAEIADELGVPRSTLSRWSRKYRDEDLLSGPHDDVEKELARLRKEVTLLRQERELLKKQQRSSPRKQVFEISIY
ncbi:transposase [Flexibacterium corallicola]|uniref:transposase n=1 Tax=Flexibacterium corallicola TaxID=3037259 RepID=UPI00286F8A2E|nr:transposase [Pseudovibrio sp. M1P-2-3]